MKRSLRPRAALLVLSAAAVLALSGCGGDDPLAEGPDEQASAPAGDNGQTDEADGPGDDAPPTVPEAAREQSEEGAVAFTEHFFEALNDAYASGETDDLAKLSDPACIICRQTVGDIAFAYARGEVEGGAVEVSDVTDVTPEAAAEGLRSLTLKYSAEAYREVSSSGDQMFDSPAKNDIDFVAQVQWNADEERWLMRQIKQGRVAQDGEDGAAATDSATPAGE